MLALPLDLGLEPDERVRLEDTEEVAYSWGLPLHICAGSGKFAMADMLLARGADPNGQVCASGTPVGRAYGVRDWAMVKLLERHDGVVYAANAGYYRDAELARRLFADEAAGRLREGTVDNGTTLAETLLGTGATGGDPEIVRMPSPVSTGRATTRAGTGNCRTPPVFLEPHARHSDRKSGIRPRHLSHMLPAGA